MTRWIGVLGTKGWPDDPSYQWWWPTSPFARYLESHGIVPARRDDPFVWSGDPQGIPLLAGGKDWEAGAKSLRWYLEDLPYADRNVIAHSHGGQVALLCALEIELRSLIMVGTPVRKHIERTVAPRAAKNIGACLHLSDSRWDLWGFAGGLFDWRWSTRRAFQVTGIATEQVEGIGHAGLLRDPSKFQLWQKRGWLHYMTEPLSV